MTLTTRLVGLAALAGTAASVLAHPITFVGLPDTQFYSRDFPDIFRSQADWTVLNAQSLDVRMVSHYGDVVQNGDDLQQWLNAEWAMSPLVQSDLPLSVVAGNHDITQSGTVGQTYIPENYLEFFGPDVLGGRPGWAGASPSGLSSYQIFETDGIEILHLGMAVEYPFIEVEWAQNILAANRDKPVIVTTHRYIQDADDYVPAGLEPITNLFVESGRYPSIWYTIEGLYDPTGMQSEHFFRRFVAANPNIFMVNCGHFHEQFRQVSNNVFGNPVHEVLADYQDDPNGGNGWLRLYTIDVHESVVRAQSYSPWLGQERTDSQSRFELPVDFNAYSNPGGVFFQQGILGYSGTSDTWLNEDSGNSSYGNSGDLSIDDDVRNNIFNDRESQALIKFDNIFTSTNETGKIQLGRSIERAVLRLHVSEDHDNFLYDPDIRVYFMTKGWNESSTWNSMNGGLSSGDDYDQLLGTFKADNQPDGNFARAVDVTAAVQRWANGEPNNGFALKIQIISGNDDGITLKSSETGIVIDRPSLDVFFTPATACNPADLAAPLGILDLADVDAFVQAFIAGDDLADIALPVDILDISDIDTFITSFLSGCP